MGIKAPFSFSAIVKLKEPVFYILFINSRHNNTDEKVNKIVFPLHKEIQKGSVAKSYMTNNLLSLQKIFIYG
jgi:hypothetical protein